LKGGKKNMKNKTIMFGAIMCLAMLVTMVSVSAYPGSYSVIGSEDFDDLEIGEMMILPAGSGFVDVEFDMAQDSCFKQASKEDQELTEKLMKDFDELYEKHQKEYDALDKEIDKIFDKLNDAEDEKAWDKTFEEIDAKYEALDKKTGIDKINAELDRLYEENNCDELYEAEFAEFDSDFLFGEELTEEQMKESEAIENQIDKAYEKNADAYEKLDKQMEDLEKEYQKLDEKSGIAGLFEKLDSLWNSFWD
jgi:septal ring factor EnvC (AmiA/AmiB activator)